MGEPRHGCGDLGNQSGLSEIKIGSGFLRGGGQRRPDAGDRHLDRLTGYGQRRRDAAPIALA
jgi:hypothetical protein